MNVIIMILLISLLILVHEAGHFLAARMMGIKVDKFGFGLPFGPTLFEGQIGDTKILVHALLLGGYVSFPDDDENSEIPKDSSERFSNKPVWQRAVVISAGVIANVLCAIVLVVMTAIILHKLPAGKYDIYIAKIVAPKEAAIYKSG
ncbi:TPA: site-2 protease family protein, partial [Candidatus Spyradomonas excrementavium]|nr:site-2 protease family protein [Candidatus Spyradomonas excrementavium]